VKLLICPSAASSVRVRVKTYTKKFACVHICIGLWPSYTVASGSPQSCREHAERLRVALKRVQAEWAKSTEIPRRRGKGKKK
jgi:hypothetical protein